MKIFKFGGASVKDAEGVKNVLHVLNTVGHEDVLLVISAMGKTTNALEVVIKNYFEKSRNCMPHFRKFESITTKFY